MPMGPISSFVTLFEAKDETKRRVSTAFGPKWSADNDLQRCNRHETAWGS